MPTKLAPPGFASAKRAEALPEIVHITPGAAAAAAAAELATARSRGRGAAVSSLPAAAMAPAPSAQVQAAAQFRAMQFAQSQLMAVGQTCFMMYMFVGAQLSLIGVYMLATTGATPLRNLLGMGATFAPFAAAGGPGTRLALPKAMYAAINMGGVVFMLWKLRSSGALPLTSADWFALLPRAAPSEHASVALDVGASA